MGTHSAGAFGALFVLGLLLLPLFAAGPGESASSTLVTGESLVLAGVEPGRLMRPPVVAGSVVVRSRYRADEPGVVVYREGVDYAIDYDRGEVRRLEGSRIPDYGKNPLFGRRDFDHTKLPGFGNYREFVFVDYRGRKLFEWPVQARQRKLLPRTRARLKAGEPLTVVAFGDSITAGGDATAPELIYWQRWLDSLRAHYPKAKITGINGATGGDTTVQGLARLQEKVLAQKPDLVLVAFGMNDQNVGSVPLERFRSNLEEIVDRIRKETGAEVALLSSCLPNPNWHWTSGKMPEYGRVTGEVAAEKGCAFADVLTNWQALVQRKKPEDLLANNVNHPNDFGHWMYFRVLEEMEL